jgi:Trk K+ transport system NAD-binding subunit
VDDRSRSTRTIGLRNRVRYHFDNLLARGTWAVLLYLGVLTLAALVVSAVLLTLAGITFAGSRGGSIVEAFWQSLLRVIDPGTMVPEIGWGRRLFALLITLFGILIGGALIGLIASGVRRRVEQMQRGRSVVAESDHVLILGASSRLPVIINQLTLAGRLRRRNAIVVLADREPQELNEEVRSLVTDTRGSRLVFRWGDPSRGSDLALVGVDRARSVIILADEEAVGDGAVVKAVLAVGAELGGYEQVPIVAELTDPATAESLADACGGNVHPLVPTQAIARITAFTLGAPGVHQVVEELLDYRGCDLYVRDLDGLAGSSFGQIVFQFDKARPIGLIDRDGVVELNPAPQSIPADGDRLVIIADDETELLAPSPFPEPESIPNRVSATERDYLPEQHFLIIGWNALARRLLEQLHDITAAGSSARVVYDSRLFDPEELDVPLVDGLSVTFTPSRLDSWQPASSDELDDVTSIVFLGYRRHTTVQEADGRTLLNLLIMKRSLNERGGHHPRIVAEVLNADNVELARAIGADDFVVSDALASRFITQLAGQPERRPVGLSLYYPGGASIRLIDASDIGVTGTMPWHDVVVATYRYGSAAIGWRRASDRGGDLRLNPSVSEQVVLDPTDMIVVIA